MLLLMLLLAGLLIYTAMPAVFTKAIEMPQSSFWTFMAFALLAWTAFEVLTWLAAVFARMVLKKPRVTGNLRRRVTLGWATFTGAVVAIGTYLVYRSPVNSLMYDLLNSVSWGMIAFGGVVSLRNVEGNLKTLAAPASTALPAQTGFSGSVPPPSQWTYQRLETLQGRELEQLVCNLLQREGHQARLTPATRDGGYDIELVRNGKLVLVECKGLEKVTVEVVRALGGTLRSSRVEQGMIFTTGRFTPEAEWEAQKQGIELVGGAHLLARLHSGGL